jgi:hypothetical protein
VSLSSVHQRARVAMCDSRRLLQSTCCRACGPEEITPTSSAASTTLTHVFVYQMSISRRWRLKLCQRSPPRRPPHHSTHLWTSGTMSSSELSTNTRHATLHLFASLVRHTRVRAQRGGRGVGRSINGASLLINTVKRRYE